MFLIIGASDCPTDLVKVVKRARQINDANLVIFKDKLSNAVWTLDDPDVNKSYDSFHKNHETIYNESFPVIFKFYKFHHNKYKP